MIGTWIFAIFHCYLYMLLLLISRLTLIISRQLRIFTRKAIPPKSVETFRVCRVFCADYFGNQTFEVSFHFHWVVTQILWCIWCCFAVIWEKQQLHLLWKIDKIPSLITQIIKSRTYSDCPWKIASNSFRIKQFSYIFVQIFVSCLGHQPLKMYEKITQFLFQLWFLKEWVLKIFYVRISQ